MLFFNIRGGQAFVGAMIAVVIVVSLIPTLLNATGQVSGDVPNFLEIV